MMLPTEIALSDETFMPAAEKRKVLAAWVRFLKNGCELEQFTEALYHHLMQHCSFIAHFDRHGFYDYYFGRIADDVFRFFDQFDPAMRGVSAEYGATYWLSSGHTGTDLNEAMRQAAGPYVDALRQHFAEKQRQAEIAAANNLLSKYGLTAAVAASGFPPIHAQKPQEAHPARQESLFGDSFRITNT